MKVPPPNWAMKEAEPDDFETAQHAYEHLAYDITYPPNKELRAWMKAQGWRTPLFLLQVAFDEQLLADQESFALALSGSGIALKVPRKEVTLSEERLQELDAQYDARNSDGRPSDWGYLVEDLREIRRAVQAGVKIILPDGTALQSWGKFYEWAHGRYHMLEDGYDRWIGDDA